MQSEELFFSYGFIQCAFCFVRTCAMVISVVFDGWSLGNVFVVGVANVIGRSDSNAVKFDSEATSCAFDISSQDSNFLSDRPLHGQHRFNG